MIVIENTRAGNKSTINKSIFLAATPQRGDVEAIPKEAAFRYIRNNETNKQKP